MVFNISDGIANKHYYCSGRSNAKSSRPIAKQVIAIAKLEWYPKASTVLSRKFPALTKTVYTSQAIGLSLRGLVASTRGRKFPQDLRADALPLRTQKAKISNFSDSEQRFLKKL